MRLLRQLYIGENDSASGGNLPEVIMNANGTPDSRIIGVNDINTYTPQNWSPAQAQAYQDSQQAPSTGQLHPTDYYPTLNHNVAVGNYATSDSGVSMSGSTYAPSGAIVPLGMLDARDAAVKTAAMRKAKEVQDFNDKYNKAPSSKLENVNPRLHEDYNKFMGSAWQGALKNSGGNAHMASKMLESDPNFQSKHQAYIDAANFATDIVEKTAQDEHAFETGKFFPSEEYKKLKDKLYTALDPNSPDFKNLGNIYRTWNQNRDFAQIANEVMAHAVKTQTEKAGAGVDKEGRVRTSTVSDIGFTPEQLKEGAKQARKMAPWMSQDEAEAYFQKNFGGKVHNEAAGLSAPPPKNAGDEEDYSQTVPLTQANVNQTVATQQRGKEGGVFPAHMETVFNTTGKDQQKELTFKLNEDVVDLEGKRLQNESGYIKGQVQQIASMPYYTEQKRYLTPEEARVLKEKGKLYGSDLIEWKPGAIVNVTPKTDAKGNVKKSQSVVVPVTDLEGKFGKSFDEHAIKKVKEDALKKNSYNTQLKIAEDAVTPTKKQEIAAGQKDATSYKIKGKTYGKSAVEKAAKASGMSIDEYLAELNK